MTEEFMKISKKEYEKWQRAKESRKKSNQKYFSDKKTITAVLPQIDVEKLDKIANKYYGFNNINSMVKAYCLKLLDEHRTDIEQSNIEDVNNRPEWL